MAQGGDGFEYEDSIFVIDLYGLKELFLPPAHL